MFRTHILVYNWEIPLHFISRAIAFLFSPEVGDINGHFVDIVRCTKTKHSIQKTLATQHTTELPVLYSQDLLVYQELWLAATSSQHHERVSYRIFLAWIEIKIHSWKYQGCDTFLYILIYVSAIYILSSIYREKSPKLIL